MHAFGIMCRCCEREVCTQWQINQAAIDAGPDGSPWNNPGQAANDDGLWSDSTPAVGPGVSVTSYLELTDFGFAIPAGADITLIEFELWHSFTRAAGTTSIFLESVFDIIFEIRLELIGSAQQLVPGLSGGRDLELLPLNPVPQQGATWQLAFGAVGTPPTAAEVNAPGFGIRGRWQTNFNTFDPATVLVDYARMRICYK